MVAMLQYTKTAYTLTQKKKLPPADSTAWKGVQRIKRTIPLPNGIFCGDYRWRASASSIKKLRKGTMPITDLHKLHLSCGNNPLVFIVFMRLLSIVGMGLGIIMIMLHIFAAIPFKPYVFSIFTVAAGSFIIFHLLSKITPDKNNITMNRATGMVHFPARGKQSERFIPFAELDGYYNTACTPNGVVRYSLQVCHRYEPLSAMPGDAITNEREIFGSWEVLQQMMDVSLPLPDIPELEPVRHLDPTTRAWDEEHGRDPNYWKNFDLDKLDNEIMFSTRKLEAVDWDSLPTAHVPPEAKARASSMAQLFKE